MAGEMDYPTNRFGVIDDVINHKPLAERLKRYVALILEKQTCQGKNDPCDMCMGEAQQLVAPILTMVAASTRVFTNMRLEMINAAEAGLARMINDFREVPPMRHVPKMIEGPKIPALIRRPE